LAKTTLPGYAKRSVGRCDGPACWDTTDDFNPDDGYGKVVGGGDDPDSALVAMNADGSGRMAVVAHGRLEVFDAHGHSTSRRKLRPTSALGEIVGDAVAMYFVGDTVYVAGRYESSSALFAYPIGKPVETPPVEIAGGGVGIDDGKLVVGQ